MSAFQRVYSDEQREAIAIAYEDRSVRPARLVVELAGRGELVHNGQPLPAFTVKESTVRTEVNRLRKQRAGTTTSQLEHAEPREAIETLRRRLVNAADAMLAVEEKRKPEAMDPERLRQITRMVREAAALPGPEDPRPPAPGQKVDGKQHGGQTRGGLAGGLIADHRATQGSPTAHDGPEQGDLPHDTHRDNADARHDATPERSTDEGQRVNAHDDDSPGALARRLAAPLLAATEQG